MEFLHVTICKCIRSLSFSLRLLQTSEINSINKLRHHAWNPCNRPLGRTPKPYFKRNRNYPTLPHRWRIMVDIYLGQMCTLLVDILGKCAFSWWISWAKVDSLGGYLEQMCILIADISNKSILSWATPLCKNALLRGQITTPVLMANILGKFHIILISYTNSYYRERPPCANMLWEDKSSLSRWTNILDKCAVLRWTNLSKCKLSRWIIQTNLYNREWKPE